MVLSTSLYQNFEDELYALCALDYDVIEAYETAIARVKNSAYKFSLEKFKADHERHIQQMTDLLKKRECKFPSGPSEKSLLTQGKVILADIFSDEQILQAMLSNEKDLNIAYEKASHYQEIWPEALDSITHGLTDEVSHKSWLEYMLIKEKESHIS